MIRRLLATTALATVLATSAMAQDATAPATTAPAMQTSPATGTEAAPAATTPATGETTAASPAGAFDYMTTLAANQHLSDDMIGTEVMMSVAGDQQAGEIQNLVVSADGTVLAAILRTGGALGDESRDVAVPFQLFEWSMNAENEPTAMLTATVDEISAAPTFTTTQDTADAAGTTGAMAPAGGMTAAPADGGAMAPATGMQAAPAAPAAQNDMMADAPETDDMGDVATATANTGMGGDYLTTLAADQYLADELVGDNVYTGPTTDSDNIGSINNLVINEDGTIAGLVIGVGGFLGIGQKNVGVPFDAVALTNNPEGEQHASLAVDREALENAAPFEGRDETRTAAATPADTAGTGMAAGGAAATGMAAAPAGGATTAPAGDMAAAPATGATDTTTTASTEGTARPADLTPVAGADLTADNLIGTTVYGPDDSSIGSVGDIALTPEGQVDAVIVDVGGFLGIGAKPVAVAMDNLQFMRDSGGSMYLSTAFTQEQLGAAPEYDRDSYADNRDSMRIESGATTTQQ
ncbi:PRC-barrel domain-containing protein [Aureimonas frigidaquae]|uniref:PRC-barrel domain-containing protein n=1 Tax=Aureimonas frigidaquae TaxID=424757 RepID=UPI00078323D9|nr:PRC-barrel domain-containing protein [Aureimonas frigidaquae]